MSELVAKEDQTALANPITSGGINARDIIIPIVLVRQPTFKREHMRAFQPGDILKMPGAIPVAKYKETVEIVPLALRKQYRVLDVTKASEPKCIRYEDWKEGLEWEWTDGGQSFRRDQCFSVFIMFREDLERQAELMKALERGEIVDPDDFALPVRLVLSRAAFQYGKVLASYFELCKAANNQSPAAFTWLLRAEEKTNEHGTWYIMALDKAQKDRKLTPKHLLSSANFWVETLKSKDVKLAEEDEAEVIDVSRDVNSSSSEY